MQKCKTEKKWVFPTFYMISIIYVYQNHNIMISADKRLVAINRIQNKRICLHNIFVCIVYIYYVYINTHTYSIYFENIYLYLHKYIYIHIIYIIYKYINVTYFS